MNDIGVAVVGAGMAGRAHAAGYRSATTLTGTGLPPVRLVSVADVNPEFARGTAERVGYARADECGTPQLISRTPLSHRSTAGSPATRPQRRGPA